MKNIQVLVIMVGMLLTASAVGAVNYPTYKPTYTTTTTIAPQQQSATTEGSLTPMLNEDGTAVNPYASSAPAQASTRVGGPRRVSDNDDFDDGPVPIGSVWVLLLFALGYMGVVAMRKKSPFPA